MKQVPHVQIQIGQYWECVKESIDSDDPEYSFYPGDIGIVADLSDNETIHFYSGEKDTGGPRCTRYQNYTVDEFYDHFRLIENGPTLRAALVVQLQNQITDEQLKLQKEQQQLLLESQSGLDAVSAEAVESTPGLLRSVEPKSMTLARQSLGTLRNSVRKYEVSVRKKINQIEKIVGEQSMVLERQMKAAQELVAKLSEVVWTFDLYLGKEEEIVKIAKGKPAPAEEKIVIRQLTLYMDEESAVLSEKGGITFDKFEDFDKWITESPAHLHQVLPESKGVVAIKPRRNGLRDIDNTNIFAKMADDEANKKTYWLIRNGENLYRICTTLEVADHIIPFDNEFEEIFTEWEYVEGKREKVPLKPGSRDYLKAMENAEASNRDYMRILLLLQGLVDRTPVFKPYPHGADRINIMAERTNEQYVRYIYDADPKKLLDQNRPEFFDWLKALNSTKLEKGVRVAGVFDSYHVKHYMLETKKGEKTDRVTPRTAHRPDDLSIHTIERREGDSFYIRYGYEKWHGQTADRRASWRIEAGDTNIIPLDFVTEEEVEFYLNDRRSRHSYMVLVPLLKTVLEVKKKEAKQEAPFRKLLVGLLIRDHGAAVEEAEAAVEELVPWFKFKNREHRALTKNDKLAIDVIVQEYVLRRRKQEQRNTLPHDRAVAWILDRHPNALYIGHKAERDYVALLPEGTINNGKFVAEYTYTLGRDGRTMTLAEEARHWRVVDNRRLRWLQVYSSSAWESWPKNLRIEEHITDVDIQAGLSKLRELLKGLRIDLRRSSWALDDDDEKKPVLRPKYVLAIVFNSTSGTLSAVWQGSHAQIPEVPERQAVDPRVRISTLYWRRRQGEVVWSNSLETTNPNDCPNRSWWEYEVSEDRYDNRKFGLNPVVIEVNEKALNAIAKEYELVGLADARYEQVRKMAEEAEDKARERIEEEFAAAVKEQYIREAHGDFETWEMDKKKWLEARRERFSIDATPALEYVIARGVDCNGKTYGEVLKLAEKHGWKKREASNRYGPPDPDKTPLDFMIWYTRLPAVTKVEAD